MIKPELINVTRSDGIITQGDCPICRATFFLGKDSKLQVLDVYIHHLKQKHADVLKEDVSQAAFRIVREATEGK